jgi:hypothetical protein
MEAVLAGRIPLMAAPSKVVPAKDLRKSDVSDDDSEEDEEDDVENQEEEEEDEEVDTEEDDEELSGNEDGTRIDYVPSDSDVRVDPPVKFHASWTAWKEYLEAYKDATLQVISIKDTMCRAEKMRRIARSKDAARVIPTE